MLDLDLAPADFCQGIARQLAESAFRAQPGPMSAASAFMAMDQTFAAVGGLVTGDQLVELLRPRIDQPLSRVARWIHERRIVSYERQAHHMVPLFQFDRATMELHHGVELVICELGVVFAGNDLAFWFATPNAWLDGAIPAYCVQHDPAIVLDAARADRFLTNW